MIVIPHTGWSPTNVRALGQLLTLAKETISSPSRVSYADQATGKALRDFVALFPGNESVDLTRLLHFRHHNLEGKAPENIVATLRSTLPKVKEGLRETQSLTANTLKRDRYLRHILAAQSRWSSGLDVKPNDAALLEANRSFNVFIPEAERSKRFEVTRGTGREALTELTRALNRDGKLG